MPEQAINWKRGSGYDISCGVDPTPSLLVSSRTRSWSDLPVDRKTLPPGPGVGCNRQGFRLQRDMIGLKKGGCVSLPELSCEVLG